MPDNAAIQHRRHLRQALRADLHTILRQVPQSAPFASYSVTEKDDCFVLRRKPSR
jgi:hypothetical protein